MATIVFASSKGGAGKTTAATVLACELVIIDMEGTASMDVGLAIMSADLVIIPCQSSDKDAMEAIKTIKMVKKQGRGLKRSIPFAIVMTRTSPAIVTRSFKAIVGQLQQADIPLFDTQLIDREAFRAMAAYGGPVNDLPRTEVSGLDKAAANAHAFTQETIKILHSHRKKPFQAVGG